MRLLSLLSFFDEPVDLLARHVDGLALAGVSHLVAADGRYELYPSPEAVSALEQRAVLDAACRHHGIGLTMHVPPGPWAGGETEKRTRLFALALGAAQAGDWFMVCDADMVVTSAPDDLLARLDAAEEESAEVRIRDMAAVQARRRDWAEHHPFRGLFRAQPIVVGPQHYVYKNALDGHPLWWGPSRENLPEPLDLTCDVVVEHRPMSRSPGRNLMKDQYYGRRDAEHVEMGPCPRCGEQAVKRVACGLRLVEKLPAGRIEELCEGCAAETEKVNHRKLRQWGFDPDVVVFNERYALPGR